MKNPIITRVEWGARRASGNYTTNEGIRKQVLHHSAGVQLKASATRKEEERVVREIQLAHMGQTWIDVGYHYLVAPSGRIYEGRPHWALGAHVLGHNTGTVGVCVLGNYETARPTKAALAGAAKALRHLPGADRPLVGHRDLGPTACPGKNLYPKLGEIARARKD